jgi:CRP-like cAMP-binding protein
MLQDQIKAAMKKSELLRSLTPQAETTLLEKSKTLVKRQGEVILLTGEEVLGLYLVVSGSVGVYPKRGAKQIATMACGDVFGEMSFLEHRKASSTIIAESPTVEIQLFSNPLVTQALDADVNFAKSFFHAVALSLSRRLRSSNQFITEELRRGQEIAAKLTSAMEDLKSEALRVYKQSEAPSSEMNKVHAFVNELIKSLTSMEERVAAAWDQQKS